MWHSRVLLSYITRPTHHSLFCSLDTAVIEKLHGLDDGVLNPAIATIVGTILGAKDKTEGIVGPILESLLKPLGLLKDKPESESTMKPDGTTAAVAK